MGEIKAALASHDAAQAEVEDLVEALKTIASKSDRPSFNDIRVIAQTALAKRKKETTT